MKNLEIKTIEHKGVKVRFRIDYDNGKVDLVDEMNNAKKWNFSGRTLDYMTGWLNVIDAMRVAIEQCKKDLEADLAEKTKFHEEEIERLEDILAEDWEKRNLIPSNDKLHIGKKKK